MNIKSYLIVDFIKVNMKKYLLEIKGYIIASLACYSLETAATAVTLFLPGYLIDHYLEGLGTIWYLVMCYVLAFSAYLIICYLINRFSDYRRIKFEKSIKKDFFDSVIDKDFEDYNKFDVGEYLSMQANDITEMCQNYLSPLLSIYGSIIMIVVFGISLIICVNFSIAIAIILGSIVASFIPQLTATELAKRNSTYLKEVGKYTSKIKTYFESHDILDKKSADSIKKVHQKDLESVLSRNMHFRKLNSFSMVLNGGSVEFITVISFIMVAMLLYSKSITIGMATAAFIYSTKFIDPIYELNVNIGRVKSTKNIQKKLQDIIFSKSSNSFKEIDKIDQIETKHISKIFGKTRINLPDMEFVYPNKYLITGDNGAGKSVLFRMLMHFYKPDNGEIQYNKLNQVDVGLLNTYSPQYPIIFETDYYNNVTLYGTYNDKNLSHYESFFPSDLIEHIKSRTMSKNLSGGEKQVIALLRALCSEKPVLLLDEPFSAMNGETIKKFLSNLDKIQAMVIIIAHNVNDYSNYFEHMYNIYNTKSESDGL